MRRLIVLLTVIAFVACGDVVEEIRCYRIEHRLDTDRELHLFHGPRSRCGLYVGETELELESHEETRRCAVCFPDG